MISSSLIAGGMIAGGSQASSGPQSVLLEFDSTVGFAPSANVQVAWKLADGAGYLDELSFSAVSALLFTEQVGFGDAFGFVLRMALESGMSMDDELSAAVTASLFLESWLAVAADAEIVGRARVDLLSTFALGDAMRYVSQMDLEDALGLADALEVAVRADLSLSSTLAMADSMRGAVLLTFGDAVALGDEMSFGARTLFEWSDGFGVLTNLRLPGLGEYQAWVMNAETTGMTSYANFPFNGLANHQGAVYGVTETGLYVLEGDTDDGEPIVSALTTGDIDFGSSREKRVPRAYLHVLQTGELILRAITSKQGRRDEVFYELDPRETDADGDVTYRRARLGRGALGVWWQFEVRTVDAGTLDLRGALEFFVELTDRRG